uniref:BCL2 interacting protein 1 n=1 Tax=Athene cunicularia TaxID=194338 RepID=A0A663MQU1_ATHCN
MFPGFLAAAEGQGPRLCRPVSPETVQVPRPVQPGAVAGAALGLCQLARDPPPPTNRPLCFHPGHQGAKTTKESLAESASNITESLMGISRMMSQQVQQSEETVQTLANSSRTILEANEEFKSMSGTIQLGRKLITKYNRRELTDKMLIFLALALFLATVLYILKKRLFPFL